MYLTTFGATAVTMAFAPAGIEFLCKSYEIPRLLFGVAIVAIILLLFVYSGWDHMTYPGRVFAITNQPTLEQLRDKWISGVLGELVGGAVGFIVWRWMKRLNP